MIIKSGMTVLFQGDSVTDAGRSRQDASDLGAGYPRAVAGLFAARYPSVEVKFVNRGVSGDRTRNLLGRWDEDCVALKPDVLSILIGINDTWRRYDSGDPMTAGEYEENYRLLLRRVREETSAQIILLEPFLLPLPEDKQHWRVDLDPKIQAARRVARDFKTGYIPLDGLFAELSALRHPSVWSADGVHPAPAGHAFIAEQWLQRAVVQ